MNGIQDLNKVVILDEMKKITGDVVCRMFFGYNFSKTKVKDKAISLALADTIDDMIV